MKTKVLSTFVLALIFAASSQIASAGLIRSYDFTTGLGDSLGAGPDLVSEGGSVGGGLYTFGQNQGLILDSGLLDNTNYAVEMRFRQTSNENFWRKLLDFENLNSDLGLYINELGSGERLAFWTGAIAGGSDPFTIGDFFTVGFTRNGITEEVQGFLNGVLQFSFIDSSSQAVSSVDRLRFFHDDNVTSNVETFAGEVDYIRIFDEPSTQVPAPATLALLGLGLAGLGWSRRKLKS